MAKKKAKQEEPEEPQDPVTALLESKKYKGRHFGQRFAGDIKWPEKVSTGSVIFDMILDGGFRCGWTRMMSKDAEAGKTSMALCWAKNWLDTFKKDGQVIYFNAEGRITDWLLKMSGLGTADNRFRIIDANSGDMVYDLIQDIVMQDKGYRYFFIIDSTDSLNREGDADKKFGDAEKVAGGALLSSMAGRRLSLPISAKGHHLFICSQSRMKMNSPGMGGGTSPSGGQAPKFYSSLTGEILPSGNWDDTLLHATPSDKKSKLIGHIQKIALRKTPNQKTGEEVRIPIKYGLVGGVWRAYEAKMLAEAWGFLEQRKA